MLLKNILMFSGKHVRLFNETCTCFSEKLIYRFGKARACNFYLQQIW